MGNVIDNGKHCMWEKKLLLESCAYMEWIRDEERCG